MSDEVRNITLWVYDIFLLQYLFQQDLSFEKDILDLCLSSWLIISFTIIYQPSICNLYFITLQYQYWQNLFLLHSRLFLQGIFEDYIPRLIEKFSDYHSHYIIHNVHINYVTVPNILNLIIRFRFQITLLKWSKVEIIIIIIIHRSEIHRMNVCAKAQYEISLNYNNISDMALTAIIFLYTLLYDLLLCNLGYMTHLIIDYFIQQKIILCSFCNFQ